MENVLKDRGEECLVMSEQMGLSVSFFCCGQARAEATAAQLMEGRQTSSLSSGYF